MAFFNSLISACRHVAYGVIVTAAEDEDENKRRVEEIINESPLAAVDFVEVKCYPIPDDGEPELDRDRFYGVPELEELGYPVRFRST